MTTPMKLLFLRHGIAEEARGDMHDFDRALTQEGRDEMDQIARGLRRLGVKPDIILSSPLIRARQTAEIVAPVLQVPVEIANELQTGSSLEDMTKLLQRYPHDTVMLVGHEPDFSAAAARLMNADQRNVILKKGGLIRVEVDGRAQPGRGRLSGLLTPKMLMLMADTIVSETKETTDVHDHSA
jgi:phosphohistidine phosphatase